MYFEHVDENLNSWYCFINDNNLFVFSPYKITFEEIPQEIINRGKELIKDDIMNVFFAQYDFVNVPLTEKGKKELEEDF